MKKVLVPMDNSGIPRRQAVIRRQETKHVPVVMIAISVYATGLRVFNGQQYIQCRRDIFYASFWCSWVIFYAGSESYPCCIETSIELPTSLRNSPVQTELFDMGIAAALPKICRQPLRCIGLSWPHFLWCVVIASILSGLAAGQSAQETHK